MKRKILIVDDNEDILETLTLLLSEKGFEIAALNSGELIFDQIGDFKPDLLIMDVMLADMDGRDICKKIKENPATSFLPVILISGTHGRSEAMGVPGAPDDFVVKPFNMNHLLDCMGKYLHEPE